MSYNIDTWKTKKLENLFIPIKALYDGVNENWKPDQPKILNAETMEVEIYGGCGQTIKGILKDGMLSVTKINMGGEGSGRYMYEIINPALKQSTGELEAVCVWEGGDSITRLTVKDGEVNEEGIDL
jgi:hypothetical protein